MNFGEVNEEVKEADAQEYDLHNEQRRLAAASQSNTPAKAGAKAASSAAAAAASAAAAAASAAAVASIWVCCVRRSTAGRCEAKEAVTAFDVCLAARGCH